MGFPGMTITGFERRIAPLTYVVTANCSWGGSCATRGRGTATSTGACARRIASLEPTEKSETYDGGVWTGTRPDGTAVPGSKHCDDWTSASVLSEGIYGDASYTTGAWTDENTSGGCAADFALYCMQSL